MDALSVSNKLSYPTLLASLPSTPLYVLDRSGKNNTANITGNVTFGLADDAHSMSVATMCYQGLFSVPGLSGFNWTNGFTASVYFRRSQGAQYQYLIGNGFSTTSSVSITLNPHDDSSPGGVDDAQFTASIVVSCKRSCVIITFGAHSLSCCQGGIGNELFSASSTFGEWHFAALAYSPVDQLVTAYFDGQIAQGNLPFTAISVV